MYPGRDIAQSLGVVIQATTYSVRQFHPGQSLGYSLGAELPLVDPSSLALRQSIRNDSNKGGYGGTSHRGRRRDI